MRPCSVTVILHNRLMVSRKLVQRTNAWLNRVEFFYTYSWVNGLSFGYFRFFLSSLKKAKKKISLDAFCIQTSYSFCFRLKKDIGESYALSFFTRDFEIFGQFLQIGQFFLRFDYSM